MQKENFKVNNGKFDIYGEKYIPLSPKGIPVIMCHDLFKDYKSMNKYVEFFVDEGYTVYAFNFGGMTKNSDNAYMTINNSLNDIQSVINIVEERKDRLTLFGVGHGAFLALYYASKNPAVVSRIMGQSPFLSIPDMARKGFLPFAKFNPNDLENTWKSKLFTNYSYNYAKEALSLDIDKILKEVLCPVCMVIGGNDEYVDARYGRKALEELSRDSFVYFLKKAKHNFSLSEINQTIDYFKEFIKEKRSNI